MTCDCEIPDRARCKREGYPLGCYYRKQSLLSKMLCAIGCHDWRDMNGVCCECGYVDPLWRQ